MTLDLIYEVLADMGIEVGNQEELSLSDIMEDSFSLMLFIANLEEKFGVEFPDESLLDINEITLEELRGMVDALGGENDCL